MSALRPFLSTSLVALLIAFGLSACGNNNETTTEQVDSKTAADQVGTAEEIRGTILDTTTKAADKAVETSSMVAEKATEAASKAAEATSEAVEDTKKVASDAVESATEAVESKLAVPSITHEEQVGD
jgi:hypothetical protein